MPVKRRKAKIRRAELPDFVAWWFENGGILNFNECRAAGFDDPKNACWGLFVLYYGDEPTGAGPRVWTRQRLREAGYGPEVAVIEEREADPEAA